MNSLLIVFFLLISPITLLANDLIFENAEIRVLPTKALSAATVLIKNSSDVKYKLIKVEGGFAKSFEIHDMEKIDGVMKMRTLDSLEIPANSKVELKSGGMHLMIFDLDEILTPGSSYKIKLIFQPKKEITVDFVAVKK